MLMQEDAIFSPQLITVSISWNRWHLSHDTDEQRPMKTGWSPVVHGSIYLQKLAVNCHHLQNLAAGHQRASNLHKGNYRTFYIERKQKDFCSPAGAFTFTSKRMIELAAGPQFFHRLNRFQQPARRINLVKERICASIQGHCFYVRPGRKNHNFGWVLKPADIRE